MTVSKTISVSPYQRLISETSTIDEQQSVDFVSKTVYHLHNTGHNVPLPCLSLNTVLQQLLPQQLSCTIRNNVVLSV